MTRKQIERVQIVGLVLVIALHLLVVPFGNVYMKNWTLDLEREPNLWWAGAITLVALALSVLFAVMTKKVNAAFRRLPPEIGGALSPAVWSAASLTAFSLVAATFAAATLSAPVYELLRPALAIALAVSLLASAISMVLFTRRLNDQDLKREWENLLVEP